VSGGWFKASSTSSPEEQEAFLKGLPRACIHEAGHAVAAHEFGKEVLRVGLKARPNNRPLASSVIEFMGGTGVLVPGERAPLIRLAGAVAVSINDRGYPENLVGRARELKNTLWDMDFADDFSKCMTAAEAEGVDLPNWLAIHAPDLFERLHACWNAVEKVAGELEVRLRSQASLTNPQVELSSEQFLELVSDGETPESE